MTERKDAGSRFAVQEVKGLGQAAVCTAEIAADEVVLKEKPLLVWPRVGRCGGALNLAEAFVKLPAPVQLNVLKDFFVPSKAELESAFRDCSSVAVSRELCNSALLTSLSPIEDLPSLHRLVLIAQLNSHELRLGAAVEPAEHLALFALGSKATHSCDPNMSSLCCHGQLSWRARRRIRKGEVLTVSYLSAQDLDRPTSARRTLLWNQKCFICCCERCQRPDSARTIQCPACQEYTCMPTAVSSAQFARRLAATASCTGSSARASAIPLPKRPSWAAASDSDSDSDSNAKTGSAAVHSTSAVAASQAAAPTGGAAATAGAELKDNCTAAPTWQCIGCKRAFAESDAALAPLLSAERELEAQLQTLVKQTASAPASTEAAESKSGDGAVSVERARALLDRVHKELGTAHWLARAAGALCSAPSLAALAGAGKKE